MPTTRRSRGAAFPVRDAAGGLPAAGEALADGLGHAPAAALRLPPRVLRRWLSDTPWIGKESVYCKAGVVGLGPVISIYQPQAAAPCGARGRWRLAPGAGHRLANGEGGATVPPPPWTGRWRGLDRRAIL